MFTYPGNGKAVLRLKKWCTVILPSVFANSLPVAGPSSCSLYNMSLVRFLLDGLKDLETRLMFYLIQFVHMLVVCLQGCLGFLLFLVVVMFSSIIRLRDWLRRLRVLNQLREWLLRSSLKWATHETLLHCVQKKKHPLTFSSISPRVVCRFKRKLHWIYLRNGRFWPCRN